MHRLVSLQSAPLTFARGSRRSQIEDISFNISSSSTKYMNSLRQSIAYLFRKQERRGVTKRAHELLDIESNDGVKR